MESFLDAAGPLLLHDEARHNLIFGICDTLREALRRLRLQIVAAVAPAERSCRSFPLPVGDSTRSHHLRVLREAGVTRTRVFGTQRLVSLRRDDLERRFPGLLGAVLAASTSPTLPEPSPHA